MSAQTIHKSQKVSKADVVFNIILYGICGLILLLIAYPLYFIIIASFSNPSEVSNGNVWFWPSSSRWTDIKSCCVTGVSGWVIGTPSFTR